jgi:hypothetical protein
VLRNFPPAANRVSLTFYLVRFEHLQNAALANPEDLGGFRHRIKALPIITVVALYSTSLIHQATSLKNL